MSRKVRQHRERSHVASTRGGEFVYAKENRRLGVVQIVVEGRHDGDDTAVAATILDRAGLDKLIKRLTRIRAGMGLS